jgi:anti-anti-sigma factor
MNVKFFEWVGSFVYGSLPLRPADRCRSTTSFHLASSQELAATPGPYTHGSPLSFDVEKTPSETIVRCTGKLITNTYASLQNTIRNLISDGNCIVLDLSHVTSLDAFGLGALARVLSSAREQSTRVDICWEPYAPISHSDIKRATFQERFANWLHLTRLKMVFDTPEGQA